MGNTDKVNEAIPSQKIMNFFTLKVEYMIHFIENSVRSSKDTRKKVK